MSRIVQSKACENRDIRGKSVGLGWGMELTISDFNLFTAYHDKEIIGKIASVIFDENQNIIYIGLKAVVLEADELLILPIRGLNFTFDIQSRSIFLDFSNKDIQELKSEQSSRNFSLEDLITKTEFFVVNIENFFVVNIEQDLEKLLTLGSLSMAEKVIDNDVFISSKHYGTVKDCVIDFDSLKVSKYFCESIHLQELAKFSIAAKKIEKIDREEKRVYVSLSVHELKARINFAAQNALFNKEFRDKISFVKSFDFQEA